MWQGRSNNVMSRDQEYMHSQVVWLTSELEKKKKISWPGHTLRRSDRGRVYGKARQKYLA